MMPLPTVKCTVCGSITSLDVLLADDVRIALLAVIDIHPQGDAFIKPLLRYIGLFAPPKSQMSHARIASLIGELEPMVKAGKIERNGVSHSAPLNYWQDALGVVLAARDAGKLSLPLKSHGYLLEVIANRANAQAAKQEHKVEADRRRPRSTVSMSGDPPNPVSKEEGRQRLAAIKKGLTSNTLQPLGTIAESLKKELNHE